MPLDTPVMSRRALDAVAKAVKAGAVQGLDDRLCAVTLIGLCCDGAPDLAPRGGALIADLGDAIAADLGAGQVRPDDFAQFLLAAHYLHVATGRQSPAVQALVDMIVTPLRQGPVDGGLTKHALILQMMGKRGAVPARPARCYGSDDVRALLCDPAAASHALQDFETASQFGGLPLTGICAQVTETIQAIMSTRISTQNLVEAARLLRLARDLDPAGNEFQRQALAFLVAQQGYDGLWGLPVDVPLHRRMEQSFAVLWAAIEFAQPAFRVMRDAGISFRGIEDAHKRAG